MTRPDNPLYGITIKEIARICHVDLTTARRWKRGARCPPKMALLLIGGDLGAFDPQWRGWRARGGKLISPEGWEITVGDVLGLPLVRQQIAAYQTELRLIRERVLLMQEQPAPADWPDWIAEVRAG
jgi:Phage protein